MKPTARTFTCTCGKGTAYITKAAAQSASASDYVIRCGLQAWHPAAAAPRPSTPTMPSLPTTTDNIRAAATALRTHGAAALTPQAITALANALDDVADGRDKGKRSASPHIVTAAELIHAASAHLAPRTE